jgi:hypothetical protein
MKTAIIVHGMPSKEEFYKSEGPAPSNNHWKPWLQKQLLIHDVLAQTPELPEPYRPDYQKWCSIFEQFPINENTMLVGHSAGGGFLVRWLSENKTTVGKVALVAPWINRESKSVAPGFFDFEIDPEFAKRTAGTMLFISSDDAQDELDTATELKEKVKDLQVQEFADHGHFILRDMKTEEFPELADFLLS